MASPVMYAVSLLILIFSIGTCAAVENSRETCGLGKECVPYYLCDPVKINKDGTKLIDMRTKTSINDAQFLLNDTDSSEKESDVTDEWKACTDILEVCCTIDDKVTGVEVIIDSFEESEEDTSTCGYRNIDGIGIGFERTSIIHQTRFGEFPWMVVIYINLKTPGGKSVRRYSYRCGGSLIAPQVVLTTARCVQVGQADRFKVRAGAWDISTRSKNKRYPEQDRKVIEIVIHEKYDRQNSYNDIALVFLDSPFELAPNVNTVCLPPFYLNFDSVHCYATGWGSNKFKNGQNQIILKKIDLPVIPNAQCQENLRTTRLGNYFELHSSFMCAGGESGKDTCVGDGGSPLVCSIPMSNEPNRFFQVGIVAWGIGCGDENIPGVYTNVPKLRPWIDRKLSDKRIESKYYTP